MEHNPFITLIDETEITYSDIKRKDGKKYITIYFETPCDEGFKSMEINYPFDGMHNIVGYTEEEVKELMHHFDASAHSAFQFAKEDTKDNIVVSDEGAVKKKNHQMNKALEKIANEFFEEVRMIKECIQMQFIYEMEKKDCNGVYGYIQKEMCYNSNRIEGSSLSKDQVASIFTAGTLSADGIVRSKDVEETTGHFAMFSYMLQTMEEPLTQEMIKTFHRKLKSGVWEDMINGYAVGEYKKRANVVGSIETAKPADVENQVKELLEWYNAQKKTLDVLSEFHIRYERIHPFQDGNGRTGRILLFRECIVNDLVPFIIHDENKQEYYNALKENSIEKMNKLVTKEQYAFESAMLRLICIGEKKGCLECEKRLTNIQ